MQMPSVQAIAAGQSVFAKQVDGMRTHSTFGLPTQRVDYKQII